MKFRFRRNMRSWQEKPNRPSTSTVKLMKRQESRVITRFINFL